MENVRCWKIGIDLTEEAVRVSLIRLAGRDKEIDRIVHIFCVVTQKPIIIGETGVGKTAIVKVWAQKIAQGSVPKDLRDKWIFQLDVASLVAEQVTGENLKKDSATLLMNTWIQQSNYFIY